MDLTTGGEALGGLGGKWKVERMKWLFEVNNDQSSKLFAVNEDVDMTILWKSYLRITELIF